MQRCSEFIQGKALFGSYPSQETVHQLEQIGTKVFVDLTVPNERLTVPYHTTCKVLSYPIEDRGVPTDTEGYLLFLDSLRYTIHTLKDGEKMYLHCKGGHGRSGVVVASLMCYLYNMHPEEALRRTTFYHGKRPEMKMYWRRLGSPQTQDQKDFVRKLFAPVYIQDTNDGFFRGLGNGDPCEMTVNDRIYPSLSDAFSTLGMHKRCRTCATNVLSKMVEKKFRHAKHFAKVLRSTAPRPIVYTSKQSDWDTYNTIGNILHVIRFTA